jgi:hypothetical protein
MAVGKVLSHGGILSKRAEPAVVVGPKVKIVDNNVVVVVVAYVSFADYDGVTADAMMMMIMMMAKED